VLDPDLDRYRRIDPRAIVNTAVDTIAGRVPTIINGRHDRVVPLSNAEFLKARLPTSHLVIIDAGHFVWEEAPAEYAAGVLELITGS
ncbi:MAG TPA: alpha/beta hydrolase, partial [Solirubrobacteraceae bacterium]